MNTLKCTKPKTSRRLASYFVGRDRAAWSMFADQLTNDPEFCFLHKAEDLGLGPCKICAAQYQALPEEPGLF